MTGRRHPSGQAVVVVALVALASAGGCATQNAKTGADGGPPDVPPLGATVIARAPAAAAADVCADTRLHLTLDQPVQVGSAGAVRIYQADALDVPVDELVLGADSYSDTIEGRRFYTEAPIAAEGTEVMITPHHAALSPGQTYVVTMDAGVLLDASGMVLGGIPATDDWRFTTRSGAPADAAHIVVAGDGSGDFCTVQGGLDAIPTGNTTPVTVEVKNGTYHEIILLANKNNITIHGEDRKNTIIAYPNNDVLQQKLGTKFRAMMSVETVNDLIIENMTLHNTTPQDGSQAEALRLEPSYRTVVRNMDILSLQDTLLFTGRIYVADSYIEGNVDYVWGKGFVYFERCELKTVGRSGYNVQARNGDNTYGYVFVDSKLTADPGVTGHYLGRIDASVYPGSNVAYVNCEMGPHINPKGWVVTPAGIETPATLRFWEYKSVGPDGQPVDVSQRDPASRQLTDEEAVMLRDRNTVLLGWDPVALGL